MQSLLGLGCAIGILAANHGHPDDADTMYSKSGLCCLCRAINDIYDDEEDADVDAANPGDAVAVDAIAIDHVGGGTASLGSPKDGESATPLSAAVVPAPAASSRDIYSETP